MLRPNAFSFTKNRKLLKKGIDFLLKDGTKVTTALTTLKASTKTFRAVRKTVLNVITAILREVENVSPGYGLKVSYSEIEAQATFNGFVTDTGALGKLEKNSFEAIDTVSPFIEAAPGRLCDLAWGSITEAFPSFVDLLRLAYRWREESEWTENVFRRLRKAVLEFKPMITKGFQSMNPKEWAI